jgi:hypothetical protein
MRSSCFLAFFLSEGFDAVQLANSRDPYMNFSQYPPTVFCFGTAIFHFKEINEYASFLARILPMYFVLQL